MGRPSTGTRYLSSTGCWSFNQIKEETSQRIGLEVTPYGISSLNTLGPIENGDAELTATGGLDVNYTLTTNLRAGLTINTDFAETEVDDRQVNLTRFPLFFPERRAFFLEGSSVYQFAPASGVNPYFSRRIGLVGGEPIPIVGGGRLIGRIGNSTEVGFTQIRTAAVDSLPTEDFTVARVVQNFGSESSLGVLYTRRASQHDDHVEGTLQDRHTIGTDFELNTSKFLGRYNLQYQAFFIYHNAYTLEEESSFFDRTSRGTRINFPNQPWDAHVSYREFGDHFDPDVGFTPRNAFRRLQPTVTYSPLVRKSIFLRELTWEVFYEHLMELDWRPATTNLRLTFLGLRLESGDLLRVDVNQNYELLDFDFDILRDGDFVIPVGEYTTYQINGLINTATWRKVVGSLSLSNGGFWTGTNQSINAALTLRPFIGVNLTGNWLFNRVSLDNGQFDTQIFRMITAVDLSPWVSINVNLQYDNVTELLGLNTRFRWIIRPGSNLFVVYNNNWVYRPEDIFFSLESQTNIKLTYTHRF